ncbi:MAG: class I SAM-dependent methyltransferase [Gemmatimonadota bacterium]
MKHPLDLSWVYLAWQSAFVEQKLAPFRKRHPGLPFRRILDIGCGPGTNTAAFLKSNPNYLGIDLNAGYIASAKERFGDKYFMVGDASKLDIPAGERFDCIFINSLLHHLTDDQVRSLLQSTRHILAPDGKVFIIDLHVPKSGLPRRLALADRGEHPRALAHLRSLVTGAFCLDAEEQFYLHIGPVNLWAMVYYEAHICG